MVVPRRTAAAAASKSHAVAAAMTAPAAVVPVDQAVLGSKVLAALVGPAVLEVQVGPVVLAVTKWQPPAKVHEEEIIRERGCHLGALETGAEGCGS